MNTGMTVALFRPVDQNKLDLIVDSDWRLFPLRLSEQCSILY